MQNEHSFFPFFEMSTSGAAVARGSPKYSAKSWNVFLLKPHPNPTQLTNQPIHRMSTIQPPFKIYTNKQKPTYQATYLPTYLFPVPLSLYPFSFQTQS